MLPKPEKHPPKPDIFAYLDYRLFLRDAFATLKAASPGVSFRKFAQQAGFTSPNFLQQVIQGKRNLGPANILTVTKAFRLNRQEHNFFQNLVGYAQARGADAKDEYYRAILGNKRYGGVKTLEKHQYEFFSQWYVPAVREMLTHPEFTGEDAWIADRIFPRITAAQVGAARALLEKIGLIERDGETGKWRQTDTVIATESEIGSLGARNYHLSAIGLAREALKHFPPQERDIRSVTIGLSEIGYRELKERMEAFWKEVLAFAGTHREAERVFQVNFQLFPLTKDGKKHA